MFKVFLSYRTTDAAYAVGHIYQELTKEFGKENIFEYTDAMPGGVDFRNHIKTLLQQVHIFIPIIGAHWIENKDSFGNLRLYIEEDPVRVEIETALHLENLTIIPVFVDNIRCPDKSLLPSSISSLIDKSAISIGHNPTDFEKGIRKLIYDIKNRGIEPKQDNRQEELSIKNEMIPLEALRIGKIESFNRKKIRLNVGIILVPSCLLLLAIMAQSDADVADTFSITGFLLLIFGVILILTNTTRKLKKEIVQIDEGIMKLKKRLLIIEHN